AIKDYRFCGKERDDATGFYYFGYRYYATWIGRWLSPDPIGPEDDLNLYRYVRNNPINLFDPDGLQGTATQPGQARTYTVRGPREPRVVLEAWSSLSEEQRAEHRRTGTTSWWLDRSTGAVDFITPEEARRRRDEDLQAGHNVGVFERHAPRPPPRRWR